MVQTLIWRIVCNKVFGGGYGYSFVGKQWAKSNRKHKSDNKENDLLKTVPLSPCYFSVDETPMTQDGKTQISADCSYWTQIDKKLQKWNKVNIAWVSYEATIMSQPWRSLLMSAYCSFMERHRRPASLWAGCLYSAAPPTLNSEWFQRNKELSRWVWVVMELSPTKDFWFMPKNKTKLHWADTVNSCCHFTSLEKMYKRNRSNTPMWHFSVQYYSCCNTT